MNSNPQKKIVTVEKKTTEPFETGVDYRFPRNIILSDDDGINKYNMELLKILIRIAARD